MLESPIFGPFILEGALPGQHLSGDVAVVFERDEGELDLVRGNEVFDESDETLERGKLANQDNAGRPEAEAGVFATHAPPLVEDGLHARGRARCDARAALPESRTST